MNPILSIIIPVYNTEKFLERCVTSILSQSFTDFEIILVDDGSTDNSPQICDNLAKLDSRIRSVHKSNGGQATARNLGIVLSKGKYITFVDSDDYIADKFTYLNCVETLDSNPLDCDIVQYPHQEEFADHINAPFIPSSIFHYFSKEEYINNCRASNLFKSGTITTSVCDKVFRRETIEHIEFTPMFLEDVVFIIDSFENAHGIIIQDKGLYRYCIRGNSTMTSNFSLKKYEDALKSEIHVYRSLLKNSANLDLQCALFLKIISNMSNLKISYKKDFSISKFSKLKIPVIPPNLKFIDTFKLCLIKTFGIDYYTILVSSIGSIVNKIAFNIL